MRLNDSTEGGWLSPDPLGGDITNPQSLNRYAYALNNPETLTDPSGLCPDCVPLACSNPTYISAECPNPPGCVAEGSEGCIPYPPGFPIGFPSGGGGGGGGTGTSALPPGPGAPPTGGEEFTHNPLPCIGPGSLSALATTIAAGLVAYFGSGPSAKQILAVNPSLSGPNPSLPVEGGAAVLNIPNIVPTQNFDIDVPMLPLFHKQSAQSYFPVPSTAQPPPGAGNIIHVTFDPNLNAAGQVTSISNVQAHIDIHNPYGAHGLGLSGHIAADLVLANILSAAQGGCAVKFN